MKVLSELSCVQNKPQDKFTLWISFPLIFNLISQTKYNFQKPKFQTSKRMKSLFLKFYFISFTRIKRDLKIDKIKWQLIYLCFCRFFSYFYLGLSISITFRYLSETVSYRSSCNFEILFFLIGGHLSASPDIDISSVSSKN